MFGTIRRCVVNVRSKTILTVLAAAITHGTQAQAADQAVAPGLHALSIPAGPLASSLKEIARATGTAVRFETREVQDLQAPALNGSLSALDAVRQAIAASALNVQLMANGELAVFEPRLGALTVVAARGEGETGFKASRSETSTRSGADLLDVPQAVSVITAKVIETQQAQSVQDVLQNVAGVITRESAQGLPSYTIRGFSQTSTLSNGINNPSATSTNIAGVERIEVLKGPQAILSGGDSLGGGVNIVLKKPTAETVRDVSLQYGSHQDKGLALDLSGALSEDKRLSARLIAAKAHADHNDAGFNGRESDYLMGQLRWKDDATDFNVGLSYDEQYLPPNRYTFALDGIQPEPDMRLGRVDDGIEVRSEAFFYSLEHAFAPWLTLVSRMQRTLSHQDLSQYLTQFPRSTADMIMSISSSNNVSDSRTTAGDLPALHLRNRIVRPYIVHGLQSQPDQLRHDQLLR
ncbi:iron complex outermembrane recepter protein [Pseudomonas flavescens]|uniref:Iron complex outermembrane recepter protein n=1 Tax=Phytopseudomonas flavescens TaxID=29435 RepID=A0A1G8GNR8_9GAMM|nr:TonB-dependent receptor plug domain-containing protein [Pseudomonas flavescens]SDH95940.1 iron complex outermembrane recepter protein [Pseudomonas flavescens]